MLNRIKNHFTPTPSPSELTNLSLSPAHLRQITAATNSHGLVLVAGGDDSGKSTTLRVILAHVVSQGARVLTTDAPSEPPLPGVYHYPSPSIGPVPLRKVLSSAIRMDPDAILIEETRDADTLQVLIHLAQTGHLVLSTLHADSVADILPRLVSMGADVNNFGSPVTVIYQSHSEVHSILTLTPR